MRYQIQKFLPLIILLTFAPIVSGQRSYNKYPFLNGFSVSPKLGVNWFFGDLVNKRPINPAFGINSEKELTEYLNARLDINGGMMSGIQINPDNGLEFSNFKNTYIGLEVGVAFHPLPLVYGFYKQRAFKPYVIGELGIIAYNATEKFGEGNLYGKAVGDVWHSTNGYQIAPLFSIGGGLNYYINKKWSVALEWVFNAPLTDMLDAHKEWELGPIGSAAQTYKTKGAIDPYYTGGVSVNYTFAESLFRNQFKYNRKSYLKTRKSMSYKKTKSAKSFNRQNRSNR